MTNINIRRIHACKSENAVSLANILNSNIRSHFAADGIINLRSLCRKNMLNKKKTPEFSLLTLHYDNLSFLIKDSRWNGGTLTAFLKGQFTQKWKFSHCLLSLMPMKCSEKFCSPQTQLEFHMKRPCRNLHASEQSQLQCKLDFLEQNRLTHTAFLLMYPLFIQIP